MNKFDQQAMYVYRRLIDNIRSNIGTETFGSTGYAIKAIATELEIFYIQGANDQRKGLFHSV